MSNWISFGYALKSRYALHTSKKSGNAYTLALSYADSAGSFSTASVGFPGNAATNENPFFQYNDQRGDIVVSSTLANYFRSTTDSLQQFSGDPRLAATTDFELDSLWVEVSKKDDGETDTLYRAFQPYGALVGEQDFGYLLFTNYVDPEDTTKTVTVQEVEITPSYPGPFLASPESSVPLFLGSELEFIKAEAYFALGQASDAAIAHNKAVTLSISEMGVDSDAGFISNYGSETSESISLEKIMNQKWVALYCNAESWTDWRRTGFPTLTPAANNSLNDQFPRRYPYPQKERTLNSSNVPDEGTKPALTKVWWDS
jgi:hypothetical protein